ncbi:MAG: GNAT family N-acetyltransferase [Streptosporangiaceae bacterium]
MSDAVVVSDNQDAARFEVSADDEIAELTYRLRASRLVLVHTEVPPSLAGRGIGGKLVQAAVSRARRDGLTIVPLCPFARSWLERHPDAASDVDIDWGDDAV